MVATTVDVVLIFVRRQSSGSVDNDHQADIVNPDNKDSQDPKWNAGIDFLESLHKEEPVGKPVPDYWAKTGAKCSTGTQLKRSSSSSAMSIGNHNQPMCHSKSPRPPISR